MSSEPHSESNLSVPDQVPNHGFDEDGHDISQFLTALHRVILRLSRSASYVNNGSVTNQESADEEKTTCER